MENKNINLLPEDLRNKKIKLPKIKIGGNDGFSNPPEDIFENTEDKSMKTVPQSALRSNSSPKPEKIIKEEKFEMRRDVPRKEPKEEIIKLKEDIEKTKKGVFTMTKSKPVVSSGLKDFFNNLVAKLFSGGSKLPKKKSEATSLNINLIFGAGDTLGTREKKLLRIIYIEIVLCLVVIISFYSYLIFSQWKMGDDGKKLQQEIVNTDEQISNFKKENKDLVNIQKKLIYIKDLAAKHVYWTKFFALLEKYTLPDVYYNDFGASTDKGIGLKCTARDSQAMVKQVLAFQNAPEFISGVEIRDIGLVSDKGEVSFILNVGLAPDVFFLNK